MGDDDNQAQQVHKYLHCQRSSHGLKISHWKWNFSWKEWSTHMWNSGLDFHDAKVLWDCMGIINWNYPLQVLWKNSNVPKQDRSWPSLNLKLQLFIQKWLAKSNMGELVLGLSHRLLNVTRQHQCRRDNTPRLFQWPGRAYGLTGKAWKRGNSASMASGRWRDVD